MTYFRIPALLSLMPVERIFLRYSLAASCVKSAEGVPSGLAVAPAPVGVDDADTTPAFTRALNNEDTFTGTAGVADVEEVPDIDCEESKFGISTGSALA